MAAYAALVSLINNVEQMMKHPRLSKCFDNQQMESLLQKARSLLDFIEGGCNDEGLEREITSAAHAAEDVIESHVVDQIHAGTRRSIDLQQVIQDMGAVAGKAVEDKEKGGVREEVEEEQPPTTHPLPHVGETAMVGLDDELTQLLDSLTDNRSNRHVISIVGMSGMGKTTLAHNLYVHQLVKEHFDIRAWATVSQQYTPKEILSDLLSCLRKSTEGKVGELGELLHKTLFGRRYLIVLDDIWGVEAWDEVRRYLPDNRNRSRVVLTTRLSSVANLCGSASYNLNLLDEDKSWQLFCKKALFPHKDGPLQLEDVAKKIVKLCKGLALSIIVIGGLLLSSPRTVGCWENVLKGLGTNYSKEKQQGLDALSLSYNHLPPHLKPCFLYMRVFKEDSRIRVSNITKLWVAEGFIKPKGSRVLEEIAEDYLKDLSDRNLVLGVERRFNGKMKTFSIHDLVRDLCIKVAEQQQFFHIRKYGEIQDTERRLVCDDLYGGMFRNKLARSILGRNKSQDIVKCKLLRVLNATRDSLHRFRPQLYGNVNLRYLAHHNLYSGAVVELPSSTYLLWNLQTLIIKQEDLVSLLVAPPQIWKMRQLRHVECRQLYLPPPLKNNKQDCMENFQTFTTAVNLRLSEEACDIIPNIKKLHLIYNAKMHGYDGSLIECLHNLDRFHKLESLSMKIKTSKWPRPDPELHSKLAFPLSLNKLCLSECKLSWKDMSVIGSLPQLQVLCLKRGTINDVGCHWSPADGQFLRLKLLEIERCDLSSWDADSSHFPVLEKLLLRNLIHNLEIPPEIGEIPTLELICVDRCSETTVMSAVKIKKDQLENQDNDTLQIEVKVYQSRVESFKKRVEAEELALNLFKLEIDWSKV